ncbi:MAG: hypothetical protein Kow0042_06260 [Calditrichia bacterium]
MTPKILKIHAAFICGVLILMTLISCDAGIEDSPQPGILRITLEADPADTSIVIITDTFSVQPGDFFAVTIFQGKVFRDSTFAVLYPTIESYKQEDIVYNIIRRDSLGYQRFTIFESHVPPSDYNRIQFGVRSLILRFGNFFIPVETEENYFLNLSKNFTVKENEITEINLQIKPFQSIIRYRDTYQFHPVVEIMRVNYLE